MASYFGEVIHPSSRAFWIDEDEEEVPSSENEISFSIQWIKDVPSKIKMLLMVEGDRVTAFMKNCLTRESNKIGIINHGDHRKPSVIYEVKKDLFICNISTEVEMKYASAFVEAVNDLLSKAEKIITITTNHVLQYKSSSAFDGTFLRILATKNADDSLKLKNIEHLEQPNIIAGVVAGVMSYAELMEIPAVLYVLYTDNFTLDSRSAQPLVKVLNEVIHCTESPITFIGERLFNKGNLYMYIAAFNFLPNINKKKIKIVQIMTTIFLIPILIIAVVIISIKK